MKKVIRLTESDLSRIIKRVIKETEEGSQEEGKCMSKMKLSDAASRAKNACVTKELGLMQDDKCIKVGTKSMYPKTYSKLKSLNAEIPLGCAEVEGQSLTFYDRYVGWLDFFKDCGDKLITIPKVPQSVVNWTKEIYNNSFEPDSINWYVTGDSIYLVYYYQTGC